MLRVKGGDLPRELPPVLPGFEDVNRYWDRNMKVFAAKILPGQFYVSQHGEMIVTVLGSCISACIRDARIGVGGMNHFMLPQKNEINNTSVDYGAAARYGNWAMEYLINEILKLGGNRRNLEVKVFGGGRVLANMTNIGLRNIEFINSFVEREGLNVQASDVGDIYPRKVLYFPDTGAVKVRKLKNMRNSTVLSRENEYAKEIIAKPNEGDVELF